MKKVAWIACTIALLTVTGCACKQNPREEESRFVAPAVEEEVKVTKTVSGATARDLFEKDYAALPTEHTVKKGECLWWIAEYQQVYNDPFMWPLIYKANRDKIKNPDRIFPKQVFSLPRHFSKDDLTGARKQAGAPRPYLPPQNANVPGDLREELGWGF